MTTSRGDSLAPFRPLITGVRWGTLATGAVLASFAATDRISLLLRGLILVPYALYRTFRPILFRPGHREDLIALMAEIALDVAVVVATGYWTSPFFFCLATAVVASGFAGGFGFATRAAIAAVFAVAIPSHLFDRGGSYRESVVYGSQVVMVALVAGYARRIFGQVEHRESLALSHMSQLSEANDLLYALHQVAQSLPASLDLAEVVASTVARLKELVDPDVIVVMLHDEGTGTWTVAASEGLRLPMVITDRNLVRPVRLAAHAFSATLANDLLNPEEGPGLAFASRSGIYAPLRARRQLVGLLVLEDRDPAGLGTRDLGLVNGVSEQAALAIDNARWFSRLRTIGADEERTRIARDLHDRVGSSLAYLAFELDRLTTRAEHNLVHTELQTLRQDVRKIVSEVRETLYDLRTDVSETQDMTATMQQFLHRVEDRTGMTITFRHAATARLPLPQERELWRIAQEAMTNVERHARAEQVAVVWRCDANEALLEIIDDGRGFPPSSAGRLDSYGLMGMRERADAIGALLEIDSAPGKGTTIRVRLDHGSEPLGTYSGTHAGARGWANKNRAETELT